MREANTIVRQAIQRGGLHSIVAVAMNVIRPQSIDGNEEDVGLGHFSKGLTGPGLCPAPCNACEAEKNDSRCSHSSSA
jgi:hypothetical protein